MLIVGIDPGAKGSVCLLDTTSSQAEFMDLKRPLPDIYDWLVESQPDALWIEDVHSLYGMSARSNFSFGKALGTVETLASLVLPEFQKVQPKIWQKEVGITVKGKAIKKAVADTCEALYPGSKIYGARGGLLDGRSDSLMIAHYGKVKHETNN